MEEYHLSFTFSGKDVWKVQEEIENILGYSNGSGFDLSTHKRDLSYDYECINMLKSDVRRIRKIPRRIKCEVWKFNGGEREHISLKGVR